MEKVEEFLDSDHRVMLLLGDSGAGKSTFNRTLEGNLWSRYTTKQGRIPLYINLPAIDKPEQDLVAKHLRRHGFSKPQIRELRIHHEFVVICDGYDESQLVRNLYTSNQLNEKGQWRVQMVISCRSEYLPQDYSDRFRPMDQNRGNPLCLFQQAVVTPFTPDQINDYISRYVMVSRPLWKTKDYLDALDKVPDLMELVKNPFLLTLSLEVLPRMMDPEQDVSAARVTRVALYDQFVDQWLERGKRRLSERSDLSGPATRAFERLTDEGFTRNGMAFVRDLAGAIYKNQGGNPVVEYSHKRDQNTWKGRFFNRDDENQLLLEACPMIRNGSQHRFVHRSLLEYCFTRVVFEPQEAKISNPKTIEGRRRSVSSMFSFEDRVAPEENGDAITSVVYSPGGQQIASGGCDRTVRLWDTQIDAPGLVLEGHTDFVLTVAYRHLVCRLPRKPRHHSAAVGCHFRPMLGSCWRVQWRCYKYCLECNPRWHLFRNQL